MKRTDRRRDGGGLMAKYRVVLYFPKQAAFEMTTTADGPAHARRQVEVAARMNGWVGRVYKIQVVPVERQRRET